jgi:hypothetical protein
MCRPFYALWSCSSPGRAGIQPALCSTGPAITGSMFHRAGPVKAGAGPGGDGRDHSGGSDERPHGQCGTAGPQQDRSELLNHIRRPGTPQTGVVFKRCPTGPVCHVTRALGRSWGRGWHAAQRCFLPSASPAPLARRIRPLRSIGAAPVAPILRTSPILRGYRRAAPNGETLATSCDGCDVSSRDKAITRSPWPRWSTGRQAGLLPGWRSPLRGRGYTGPGPRRGIKLTGPFTRHPSEPPDASPPPAGWAGGGGGGGPAAGGVRQASSSW